MNNRVIHLKAKTIRKNDTYAHPLKKEVSSKEITPPKKIFLNIDGHCLINVDDISYVGIEKEVTFGSCEDLAKITDLNEKIRTKTVYMVKIRSSNGYVLWSSDAAIKVVITHLYYRIQDILKKYGITTQYVEFEPSEFRL